MPWTLNLHVRVGTLDLEAQIDGESRTIDVRLAPAGGGREQPAPPWPVDAEEIFSRAG